MSTGYGEFIALHSPVYTARTVTCGCGFKQRCVRDTTGHGLPWLLRFLYRRHIDELWSGIKGAK